MFKIRNKLTGEFSSGGAMPRWTSRGKMWSTLGHVKQHINSHSADYGARREYHNGVAEVVMYTPVEAGCYEIKDI